MCGRYTLAKTADELIEVFDIASVPDFALDLPRFNIAPTQVVPALVLGSEGRRLGALKWGLLPPGPAIRRSRLLGPDTGFWTRDA